jgi:hypothetical protein
MLVVKVDLWPGGREDLGHEIAAAYIWNESDLASMSDYSYELAEKPSSVTSSRTRAAGKVRSFPRRKLGTFDLLYRVLKDAVGDRN